MTQTKPLLLFLSLSDWALEIDGLADKSRLAKCWQHSHKHRPIVLQINNIWNWIDRGRQLEKKLNLEGISLKSFELRWETISINGNL